MHIIKFIFIPKLTINYQVECSLIKSVSGKNVLRSIPITLDIPVEVKFLELRVTFFRRFIFRNSVHPDTSPSKPSHPGPGATSTIMW